MKSAPRLQPAAQTVLSGPSPSLTWAPSWVLRGCPQTAVMCWVILPWAPGPPFPTAPWAPTVGTLVGTQCNLAQSCRRSGRRGRG